MVNPQNFRFASHAQLSFATQPHSLRGGALDIVGLGGFDATSHFGCNIQCKSSATVAHGTGLGRNQGTRSYSNSFNLPNFLNDDDSIQPASGGTGSKCSK